MDVVAFDRLNADVQDCIVASMNVTTILTYSTSSRSAQSAVNRWKVRIATLAGLARQMMSIPRFEGRQMHRHVIARWQDDRINQNQAGNFFRARARHEQGHSGPHGMPAQNDGFDR